MARTQATRRRVLRGCGALGVVGLAGCANRSTDATTDADFPPGLTADGLEDPAALLEAHRRALPETSFTGSFEYRYRDSVKDTEATTTVDSFDIRADPAADRVVRTRHGTVPGYDRDRVVYVNGEYRATNRPAPLTHDGATAVIDDSLESIENWMLDPIDEYEGTRATDTGPVHEYRLSETTAFEASEGVPVPDAFPGSNPAGTGRILVDEAGRIRRYRTTQRGQFEAISSVIDLDITFGQFGRTEVAEPKRVDPVGADGHRTLDAGTKIELALRDYSWLGVEPAEIRGFDDPTLVLAAGKPYEVSVTGVGRAHDFEIRDAKGDVVDTTDGTSLEFVASEAMTSYRSNSIDVGGEVVVR
ncbi:blue (type 1) copper domain-containing protein [Natrinema pellirubrum DSM 15624]|uniref:Blue (Type 1) copper domain-containing protein n=1 Tax=Natrinema pellirubrum (strain DSM 15624 / CIP 106293 / JCM 10476 / NCIMB 786 / 157) TaxID=797303 RepID=L0JPX1_NATP1|nr:hypothetical protein [Natrinema pellirubrum]AGB32667.1 hypothetical protein Natpe_2869 [Natrinema pellirubrum DSM 15624]ELY73801.1 blue (type 1) copper domain-containing protein [Natrinema pellirubrum DSM 15624]